jgi:hypothetical protein
LFYLPAKRSISHAAAHSNISPPFALKIGFIIVGDSPKPQPQQGDCQQLQSDGPCPKRIVQVIDFKTEK